MRGWLVAALLLSLAFAGCAGSPNDDDGTGDDASGTSTGSSTATGTSSKSTSGSSTKSGSSSATGTGAPADNRAPTALLSASTAGGSIPLSVNFTLNGTDADGDDLTWTLSFGDGSANQTGNALPANATHAYTAAGSFNVTFVVSDGVLASNDTLRLNVTAAGNTAGQSASLVWDVGITHATAVSSGGPYADCADTPNKTFNYDSFTLDAATLGVPFEATISAATGAPSIAGWTVYFNLADCSDYAQTFSVDGAAKITGTVPANAGPFVFAMATGGFLIEVEYRSGSQIGA